MEPQLDQPPGRSGLAVVHPGDELLPRVAPLRERHGPLDEARHRRRRLCVDVGTHRRPTRPDPQRVVGRLIHDLDAIGDLDVGPDEVDTVDRPPSHGRLDRGVCCDGMRAGTPDGEPAPGRCLERDLRPEQEPVDAFAHRLSPTPVGVEHQRIVLDPGDAEEGDDLALGLEEERPRRLPDLERHHVLGELGLEVLTSVSSACHHDVPGDPCRLHRVHGARW